MKTNPNDSAFATQPPSSNGLSGEEYQLNYGQAGLTKREYFAAMAMQGILANLHNYSFEHDSEIAKSAIYKADALITELNKP